MSKQNRSNFHCYTAKYVPRFNIVHKDFKSKLDKYNYIGIENKACSI